MEVTFSEGVNTLEATGYVERTAVAHERLSVDYRIGGNGPLADITLTATPREDGLVLIEALAIDAKGRRVLDSAERVHFSADGAGTLLANYGVPDKSEVIEIANRRATILYRPEPGHAGVIGVLSQNFRGRYISVAAGTDIMQRVDR